VREGIEPERLHCFDVELSGGRLKDDGQTHCENRLDKSCSGADVFLFAKCWVASRWALLVFLSIEYVRCGLLQAMIPAYVSLFVTQAGSTRLWKRSISCFGWRLLRPKKHCIR